MKCERARELMLTDHMDGELNAKGQREMREHLRVCTECGNFEKLAREDAARPFALAGKEKPPAYIWEGIKEKIALSEAGARAGIFANVVEVIRQIFSSILRIPKPIAAFAAGAMILIAILAAVSGSQSRALDEYLNEQASFLARLDAGQANGTSMFDTDIATGMENIL
ncbi:MAG: zf-HC2 domain-containing protein [Candidatus Omnitrophica bacterium]|nr:zf-HC2 domain-containing protein [Candidatus Omnitrophota bacterium]